ncbi:hypothetical protein FHS61_001206 [Altererythrobacter atlanticus]|uniref:PilZ domain protein n=1 Tax=Croceibacterium atlanticum TaxID=1267766 RepID=A0A0F7KU28_9SPHN|nr:PilZ domain-containing protein [Croceibacterium atlanticum]AKH43094.1 PilZ domain protein [Croceibacterium atlanticum]MBB5732202.1 hypothetical protein [Croceibacterium atlanticum]
MDERTSKRVVVDVEVEARIDERPCRIFVTDLSTGGCMIEAEDADLVPGDRVMLHFERLVDIGGRIVWLREGVGGVQFHLPLHAAVVERLGFRPGDEWDSDTAQLFDNFGRPLPVPRPPRAIGMRH